MGLRTSLPLIAGSGAPAGALNLYSRDEAAMAALTRVYAVSKSGSVSTSYRSPRRAAGGPGQGDRLFWGSP